MVVLQLEREGNVSEKTMNSGSLFPGRKLWFLQMKQWVFCSHDKLRVQAKLAGKVTIFLRLTEAVTPKPHLFQVWRFVGRQGEHQY